MPNLRDDYDEPYYGDAAPRDYGGIDAGYRGGGNLGGGWSGGRRIPEPYRGQSSAMEWPTHERPRSFRGRGPKNYIRSDERIGEDLCERLTEAGDVDATDIDVAVSNGEVRLRGSVRTRDQRIRAEEIARRVVGVKQVINEID